MSRIETLIGAMTLAEKLGQMTMTASSYAVTGPVIAGDSTDAIKAGTIGNLLNMVGAAHVREMQRLAVEESRLGIPLLIGFDVVHGHRTLFPVPLGEASLFDPETWALTARESAKEGGRRRTGDDLRADAGCGARSALGANRRRSWRGSLARRAHRGGEGARLSGRRSLPRRMHSRRSPSTIAPTAPLPPDAITPRSTFPNAPCAKCTCRRSRRRSPRALRRSCPRSRIWRAYP